MKKCLFLAQENSFSSTEIKQMEGAFLSIYHQQYPQEKLQFLWMLSPKGYAYTTSTVQCSRCGSGRKHRNSKARGINALVFQLSARGI